MRFKIDQNLPDSVAVRLREAGHDSATIHEERMVGQVGLRVAAVCQAERRALVTLDLDFSDIRSYPPQDYFGIIVLRPRTQGRAAVLSPVAQVIPLIEEEQLVGRLWIVQVGGVRVRGG